MNEENELKVRFFTSTKEPEFCKHGIKSNSHCLECCKTAEHCIFCCEEEYRKQLVELGWTEDELW